MSSLHFTYFSNNLNKITDILKGGVFYQDKESFKIIGFRSSIEPNKDRVKYLCEIMHLQYVTNKDRKLYTSARLADERIGSYIEMITNFLTQPVDNKNENTNEPDFGDDDSDSDSDDDDDDDEEDEYEEDEVDYKEEILNQLRNTAQQNKFEFKEPQGELKELIEKNPKMVYDMYVEKKMQVGEDFIEFKENQFKVEHGIPIGGNLSFRMKRSLLAIYNKMGDDAISAEIAKIIRADLRFFDENVAKMEVSNEKINDEQIKNVLKKWVQDKKLSLSVKAGFSTALIRRMIEQWLQVSKVNIDDIKEDDFNNMEKHIKLDIIGTIMNAYYMINGYSAKFRGNKEYIKIGNTSIPTTLNLFLYTQQKSAKKVLDIYAETSSILLEQCNAEPQIYRIYQKQLTLFDEMKSCCNEQYYKNGLIPKNSQLLTLLHNIETIENFISTGALNRSQVSRIRNVNILNRIEVELMIDNLKRE